jgi:hypothetical protein
MDWWKNLKRKPWDFISGLPDIDLPLNQFWESWKTPSKVGDLADSLHLECTLSIMRVYLALRECPQKL